MMTRLVLERLRFDVHLGVTDAERAGLQSVAVSLAIRFARPPAACSSDRLEETLCYEALSSRLRETLLPPREFRLIEHLAARAYDACKPALASGADSLTVRVHKVSPPIPGLEGGATFDYGDGPW